MISRYGGRAILASITEDEIVENFLSIVRYGLKYFNFNWYWSLLLFTAQKMKFSIKDFFSKCD